MNSPQYKNASVANFVSAAPVETKKTNEDSNLERMPITSVVYISKLLVPVIFPYFQKVSTKGRRKS